MMIGEIILFIALAWVSCLLICLWLTLADEDVSIDNSVMFIFPANLIFIIKYWWKALIKAIKS